MKANQIILKNTILSLLYSLSLFFLSGYTSFAQKDNKSKEYKDYSVAAYVWPSCHDEPRSREVFWGEGIGEWEIIKKGNPL